LKEPKTTTSCLLATTALLLLFAPLAGLTAAPKGEGEYDAGVLSYKAKEYPAAAAHFGNALKQGKQSAALWLYCGNTFAAMGQYPRAYQSYDVVTKSFKGTSEATTAAQAMGKIKTKAGVAATAAATSVAATGLAARITVIPPRFGHPAVGPASIAAVKEAIAALPRPMRKLLDDSGAAVVISPNLIDRWPESLKDLPENDPAETLAELPGRIYGHDMCVYERAKIRHSTNLKGARPPRYIKHQILNMCFQLLDDIQTISKSKALRTEYEYDKAHVPDSIAPKLAIFLKNDDWGPRETCSELTGAMLGGGDENTELLYRYFPRTKKWLGTKLGI
jgi:hypothetical protein